MDTLSEVYEHAQEEDKDIKIAVYPGSNTGHGRMLTEASDHELALFASDGEDVPVEVQISEDDFVIIMFPER